MKTKINQGSLFRKMAAVSILVLTATTQVACDNAVFGNDSKNANAKAEDNGPKSNVDLTPEADLVFIDDSFERDDIFFDVTSDRIYGWRGFILDGANALLGFQASGAGASIPAANQLGSASDGSRFLLLNGRNNAEAVETIHVVSQSYDLSNFNSVILNFKYLTVGLNDATDTVPENLEVQVCRGTLNECGANDDGLSIAGQQSNNWVKVFENNQNINDDSFNGKNHNASDWNTGLFAVDLNNPELIGDGSTFVFRIVARMKDGLNAAVQPPKEDCKCHHDHKYCPPSHHSSHKYSTQTYSYKPPQKPPCKYNCHCDKKCTTQPPVADGTYNDAVLIDKVVGIATQRTIDEIF